MVDREELVTIYETQGLLTADLIKSKLEAAGIPALLKYESAGWIIGVTVDGLGRVEIQVPAQYEDEALAVVQEDEEDAPIEE